MLKKTTKLLAGVLSAVMLTGCGGAAASSETGVKTETGFTPALDQDKAVNLEMAGFLGNFEALDQVVNNFNEYYPNVTISYEQNGSDQLAAYLQNNQYVDIFMTADKNLRYPDQQERYVAEYCEDLKAAGLDLGAVRPEMMESCSYGGKVLRLPLGVAVDGMAVNKTLLEKEGLSVPTTYEEFLQTLAALKEKGYAAPIQGAGKSVYYGLVNGAVLTQMGSDPALLLAVANGEESAVPTLEAAFSQEQEILQKGYTDPAVNDTYPEDNYDGAIMNFLNGDVPFWFCSSEKFSGTKKREAKSEAFTANPFEYEFCYVPTGDTGIYAYNESWYGFSVNKNSNNKDYALEFMRYLAQKDQLQTMAQIKGLPSVTDTDTDTRYESLSNTNTIELSYTNTGAIETYMTGYLEKAASALAAGEVSTPEEAAKQYLADCAEVTAKMAAE